MAKSSNFYYHFAVGTCLLSIITTISLLIIVPLLCSRASWDRDLIAIKSERFRTDMNRIWSQLSGESAIGSTSDGPSSALYFTRVKRSPWDKAVCSECNQLACPIGMPGAPGAPGIDGESGSSGLSGKAGDDGYDVELEPQDDLPCVICPAGPPGLRGMQGERGVSGSRGPRGEQGNDGKSGSPGPLGPPGKIGSQGIKGGIGLKGESGDTIVAGVGIRGPNGPPGVPGPKGPIGRPGKPSREAGSAGPPGQPGPIGSPGTVGRFGDDGEQGPPGEHGQPAAYCHSDCGVSQILAPSVSEMMSSEMHTMGDGSAGYTNLDAKSKPSSSDDSNGYNQDVHPIHSVGASGAYSGYYNTAAQV